VEAEWTHLGGHASYPAEWLTRRVSGVGNVRVSGDNTFLSTALAGQLVGLWRESELHWRVHYFDVDLGTIVPTGPPPPSSSTVW
jgi:hypothetical protein